MSLSSTSDVKRELKLIAPLSKRLERHIKQPMDPGHVIRLMLYCFIFGAAFVWFEHRALYGHQLAVFIMMVAAIFMFEREPKALR